MSNNSSESNANLSELVQQIKTLKRKNDILEERLNQSEKEKIEYLQNVSHQLVAPLNAIKWHIENLTEARIGVERAKKVLRSIYSQATIAVHLAKNFSLMSNLEADHALSTLKEPLQEVNLCKLLVNLADDFQPLGWEKNIQIKVVNDGLEGSPQVLVMKPLVSQVFSNIIENAVKYTFQRENIIIEGYYDRSVDSVVVKVKNKGFPLSQEDMTKVFERGYRSNEAKQKYPAGTGFGLYIAKRIIDLHEGTISASNENGWVTFTVVLTVRKLEGKARKRE